MFIFYLIFVWNIKQCAIGYTYYKIFMFYPIYRWNIKHFFKLCKVQTMKTLQKMSSCCYIFYENKNLQRGLNPNVMISPKIWAAEHYFLKSIHHKVDCLLLRNGKHHWLDVLRRNQFVCIAQDKQSTLWWINFRTFWINA